MSELPTIHPLQEKPPRWAVGDANSPDRECGCNDCRHWHPLFAHVLAQLDDEGKRLFSEYVEYVDYRFEDASLDCAKLEGSWPGWECLKGFSPWTHKVVEMTEEEKAQAQRDYE